MDIRKFCTDHNMTEKEFADFAGVSVRTLHKYNSGGPIRKQSSGWIERAIEFISGGNYTRPSEGETSDPNVLMISRNDR